MVNEDIGPFVLFRMMATRLGIHYGSRSPPVPFFDLSCNDLLLRRGHSECSPRNWNPFSLSLVFKFVTRSNKLLWDSNQEIKNKLEVDLLDFDLSIDFFFPKRLKLSPSSHFSYLLDGMRRRDRMFTKGGNDRLQFELDVKKSIYKICTTGFRIGKKLSSLICKVIA